MPDPSEESAGGFGPPPIDQEAQAVRSAGTVADVAQRIEELGVMRERSENRLVRVRESIPVIMEVATMIGDIVKEQGCEAKLHFAGDCQNLGVELRWDPHNTGLVRTLREQIEKLIADRSR